MQRWFFADKSYEKSITPDMFFFREREIPKQCAEIDWTFNVQYFGQLCSNEILAITGNLSQLGLWKINNCKPMILNLGKNKWSITIKINCPGDVEYRFLVLAIDNQKRRLVRFWEAHPGARLLRDKEEEDDPNESNDQFGYIGHIYHVERGWLIEDTVALQIKFINAPFVIKKRISAEPIYVKISPINLSEKDENQSLRLSTTSERSSEETVETSIDDYILQMESTFAFCEVASLKNHEDNFRYQSTYGKPCGPDDMLIFQLTLGDFYNTGYCIDLYYYPPKAAKDVLPYHLGYHNIKPEQLNKSMDCLNLMIMCASTHRPIGCMKCHYLLVRPLPMQTFDLERNLLYYSDLNEKSSYNIAHRGCGRSFWFGDNILRENTIKSLKLAVSHGADMLEFDINVTKDKVPIVYHDMVLNLTKSTNFDNKQYDIMHLYFRPSEMNDLPDITEGCVSIPLYKFTLAQLKKVSVYEPDIQENILQECQPNRDHEKPFETLRKVLKVIPINMPCILDIKWPLQLMNGDFLHILNFDNDINEFVDIILKEIFHTAGTRRIIFNSFSPDVCTLLRLKQNMFPVLLLTKGSSTTSKFLDPNCYNSYKALYFSNVMDLFGMGIPIEELMNFPDIPALLHRKRRYLFSWGHKIRYEDTRKDLMKMKVDGILFDRINHVELPDDLSGSIFIVNVIAETTKDKKIK